MNERKKRQKERIALEDWVFPPYLIDVLLAGGSGIIAEIDYPEFSQPKIMII